MRTATGFAAPLPTNNASVASAKKRLEAAVEKELLQDLRPLNGNSLTVVSSWKFYPSFGEYLKAAGGRSTVGRTGIMLSSGSGCKVGSSDLTGPEQLTAGQIRASLHLGASKGGGSMNNNYYLD